mgnify:CR=1 FL=1
MVGLLEDYHNQITMGFTKESDVIVLLGDTKAEFGGSEYLKQLTGKIQGPCPELDMMKELALWQVIEQLNAKKLLRSAHDLSEGGLATSLFESSFVNGMGFKIEVNSDLRADEFLFSETQSRVLISFPKEEIGDVLPILKNAAIEYTFLGDVREGKATILYNGNNILDTDLKRFKQAHQTGFEKNVFG